MVRDPPTNANKTDNFRFMPPDKCLARIFLNAMRLTFWSHLNVVKNITSKNINAVPEPLYSGHLGPCYSDSLLVRYPYFRGLNVCTPSVLIIKVTAFHLDVFHCCDYTHLTLVCQFLLPGKSIPSADQRITDVPQLLN